MLDFKYCRACLVTDINMSSLDAITCGVSIGEAYKEMLQISLLDRQQHFCFECVRLLCKYQEFKSRCHRANDILSKTKLSKDTIRSIDRKQNKLVSSFSLSPVVVTDNLSKDNEESIIGNEIKPEAQPRIEEISVKNEGKNDIENYHNISISNNDIDQNDQLHDEYENRFTEDISTVTAKKQKHKCRKTKKEPKARKRKNETSKINETEKDDGEKPLSDEEPLSKLSKNINKDAEGKNKYPKSFNVSYFEDFATVVFLTPEDAKKELLSRKESANYKNSAYKCELCYKGYEAQAAFDNHLKRHSADYGKHECDLCHLRFPEQRFLCKHRLACHKRKFYCNLCPYTCFCTHQAKTHVSLHKGKKYPCEDCGEIFSMPNSLLMHKRLKHLTECVCELCGSTFATPKGLFSHNMKIHRQDKNEKLGPKCEDCGIHFASEVAWKKHRVLSSRHAVSNGCKYCGETFTNREELKSHAKVHARKHFNRSANVKLPAACDICEKWLSDRNEYKSHMMADHPQSEVAKRLDFEEQTPFVCEVCGKMFKKQCFLTYHQRKHTGERPYKCTECGKSFQLASALSTHKIIHTRRRTHKCDICGRVFTFKSALNKHMKVHLGIRPHKCAICDKSFISPCDVRVHIKYVHNKVPWPKRDRRKQNSAEENAYLQYN